MGRLEREIKEAERWDDVQWYHESTNVDVMRIKVKDRQMQGERLGNKCK